MLAILSYRISNEKRQNWKEYLKILINPEKKIISNKRHITSRLEPVLLPNRWKRMFQFHSCELVLYEQKLFYGSNSLGISSFEWALIIIIYEKGVDNIYKQIHDTCMFIFTSVQQKCERGSEPFIWNAIYMASEVIDFFLIGWMNPNITHCIEDCRLRCVNYQHYADQVTGGLFGTHNNVIP